MNMDDRTKGPMRPKDKTRRKSTRKVRALQSRKAAVKALLEKHTACKHNWGKVGFDGPWACRNCGERP
jgi:hypothetical protein